MKRFLCLLLVALMIVPAAISESVNELQIEVPSSFILVGGEIDEYGLGKEMALNEKTSEEYRFIGYFLPAGVYSISNMSNKYPVQVSVYKNEIVKPEKWEEFVMSDQRPVLIFAGASKEITVQENEFIKISDGDMILVEFISELTQKAL